MDFLRELEKWKIKVASATDTHITIPCPVPSHNDESPSCQIDKETGHFHCYGCKKGGTFFDLLGYATGVDGNLYRKQYDPKNRAIAVAKITAWHAALVKPGKKTAASVAMLQELKNRGIQSDIIKTYWIGYDAKEQTITIPIRWGDKYTNVRRYRPGADKRKFQNYSKGFGKVRTLFPQDQLNFDRIVICGGEVKALLLAQELNQYGVGAISTTSGETNWPAELSYWFEGKDVYVCYDIDPPGRIGADSVCGSLQGKAKSVKNILLPLSEKIHPKGDVNDWFAKEGGTSLQFMNLLENAEEWSDPFFEELYNEPAVDTKLENLSGFTSPFNFQSLAYLSGVDDSVVHKIPRSIFVSCTLDHDRCSFCRLNRSPSYDGRVGKHIDIDMRNPGIGGLVGVNARQVTTAFKELLGIPEDCYKCQLKPSEEVNTLRYVLLSDIEADTENPMAASVITFGDDLHIGDICHVEGRCDINPLNQEELRTVTTHEPRDILDEHTTDGIEILEVFRTSDSSYEALESRLASINMDLERNVTYIYNRASVHTIFDLVYHSPLWVPFGNVLEPGWVSALVVSETAQGKSTIMRRLIDHYGFGHYIDAANTTIAGLIGGVQTVNRKQFLKWGVLPQNDKRLVCIEEYANAPVELLRAMRAARDSGVVKLDKINKGSAKARTRTIVLSNPKRVLTPNVVIDGLTLLEDLVQRPEDLRRFDIGMWIPTIEIDQIYEAKEPVYSREACHRLVAWAWTLPPENVEFTEEAAKAIQNSTMKKEFPFLYLVGGREFEPKLARLSAALAARTFNEKDGKLVIEARHVHWIELFLEKLYTDPDFGYTNRIRQEKEMDSGCTVDQITNALGEAANPGFAAKYFQSYSRYQLDAVRAACGGREFAELVVNKLIIAGCIVPESDQKYNNAYLPTKRLKGKLEEATRKLEGFKTPPSF